MYQAGGSGDDSLVGGDENDTLEGLAGDDSLLGGDGGDSLDGGTGGDAMTGGAGDDTYVVDGVLDLVTEDADAGVDTVQVGFNLTLGENLENLVITSSGSVSGSGNAQANAITGGGGNNTLDGRGGADTLTGGLGNDIYLVDDAGDVVVEAASSGTDLVNASVTYTLAADVENLQISGGGRIDGFGNGLANLMNGSQGRNRIEGMAGGDTIFGEEGLDYLFGGDGNDRVSGGDGDDRVTGGGHDDTLTGDGGNDTFVFGGLAFGADAVTDFEVGFDTLNLKAVGFEDFAELLEVTEDTDAGALITVSIRASILLQGVAEAEFQEGDFILA